MAPTFFEETMFKEFHVLNRKQNRGLKLLFLLTVFFIQQQTLLCSHSFKSITDNHFLVTLSSLKPATECLFFTSVTSCSSISVTSTKFPWNLPIVPYRILITSYQFLYFLTYHHFLPISFVLRPATECEVSSSVGPYSPSPENPTSPKFPWNLIESSDPWSNGVIVDPIKTYHMEVALATKQTPFALLKPDKGGPVLVKVVDTSLPGGKQVTYWENMQIGALVIVKKTWNFVESRPLD